MDFKLLAIIMGCRSVIRRKAYQLKSNQQKITLCAADFNIVDFTTVVADLLNSLR